MNSAVITGATGDIGVSLINSLVSNGVGVLALVRKNSARAGNIPKHPLVTVRECDLDGLCSLESGGKTYDVFYHFGWDGTYGPSRNDYPRQCKNIAYTLDALAAAKRLGCKKFVGAGSQAEYGRVEGRLTPATPAFPENGYGIAKLAAGQMGREYALQLGISYNWVRIVSVYGPLGPNLVSGSLKKLMAGEVAEFTAGEQLWDFLHCDDAAEAFRLVGECGRDGAVYVLGSGTARPLKDTIYQIADISGARGLVRLGALPYADRQVMHLQADISALTADTGWLPRVSLHEGVCRVLARLNSKR